MIVHVYTRFGYAQVDCKQFVKPKDNQSEEQNDGRPQDGEAAPGDSQKQEQGAKENEN